MPTPLQDPSISSGDLVKSVHIHQLFPIVEALENNQTIYREDLGLANAYKVDFSGAGQGNEITSYQAGQQIFFKAGHSNTGASTLCVVSPGGDLAVLDLNKFGGLALDAGDIKAGQMVLAIYNDEGSGRFEMVGAGPLGSAPAVFEDGSGWFREDQGAGANLYEVDASGAGANPREISALENGLIVTFKAAHRNTGASTLKVMGPSGSLGLVSLRRQGSPLVAGDIEADTMVTAVYNSQGSGRFEILGSQPVAKPDPKELSQSRFRGDDMYTTNAYRVFYTDQVLTSYSDGLVVNFQVRDHGANTGPSTFQIVNESGPLPAKPLTRPNGDDLHPSDLLSDQMASVMFNALKDRFELVGGLPSGGADGISVIAPFVGCQLALHEDYQLETNVEHSLAFGNQVFVEGVSHTVFDEWIYVRQTGYYEVGLVLALELATADSVVVSLGRGDTNTWSGYMGVQFEAPAGYYTTSFMPALIYLEKDERVKWTITATIDEPTVLSENMSTRCALHLVSPVDSVTGMMSTYFDQELTTNSASAVEWHDDFVDPSGMHEGYSEWLSATQDGYYEAGLLLDMEMAATESLTITLVLDDGSESDYCTVEVDGAVGQNLYSIAPIFLQMSEGDRIKWTVEPTLDAPKIIAGDKCTRATLRLLANL